MKERDRIWSLYLSGKIEANLSEEDIAASKLIPTESMPSAKLVYEVPRDASEKPKGFFNKVSASKKAHSLFMTLDEQDTLGKFLSEAVSRDHIEVPDMLSNGKAKCSESMSFAGANFLVCKSKKGLFFLCQLRRVVDAIIIPSEGIIVGRDLESVRKVCGDFIDKLYLRIAESGNYSVSPSGCSFKGLLINQSLPYHYFYDVLPGFYWLYENNKDELEEVFFAGFRDGYFLPVSQFFSVGQGDACINYSCNVGAIYKPNGFYLSCLRNDRYKRYKLIDRLDKAIFELVKKQGFRFDDLEKRYRSKTANRKVIWFGILAGKRSWDEQNEAIISIIKNLRSEALNLLFVFDGITSTEFSDNTLAGSQHSKIIKSIVDECDLCDNDYVNLNGSGSIEKLFWAEKTRFFLSDAATSSIYVSRFFGVPGICHAQPKARVVGHVHKHANFVPAKYVVDLTPEKSWIYSPYSISPEIIVPMFINSFKSTQELVDEC